ncbi:MAG: Succinoglycan biosynthesis protein ExoA [Labilithrix sp.]|nr:Succinoglycan biosynthesis protein ExoA [Labilithrix sp.]
MEENKPFVTVAVSTCEDEARIEACLRCAIAQDYPNELVEIIVADAMSMDATREIIVRIAAEDPRVRMLDNPKRTRAAALNEILRAGRGEIVVPMDPGGDYGKTHVSKCVQALAASPADHLAIVPRATGRTLVERALSAAQKTKLAFAAGAELARGSEPVPALLGAVRRRVFDRIGMFDPGTRVEEDDELSHRITQSGGAVTVRRDIVVHKADAGSFKELFKRQYLLGRSRARRTVKERRLASIRALAPLAIVVGGGALVATSSVQPITPFALAAYALVTGAAAVRVARGEGFATIPIAWAAYPVMHVAHGVGFGAGLVRALVRPDWGPAPRIGEPEPSPA